MSRMANGGALAMGREVGQIRARCVQIVGCASCGTGIAIDIVGARWGEPEYDWRGAAFGHHCQVSKDGVSDRQREQLQAIQAELEGLPRDSAQISAF